MKAIEILQRISEKDTCTETDERFITAILQELGFPNVVITCGIVYMEGHGTLEFPPTDVHTVSRMILRNVKKE